MNHPAPAYPHGLIAVEGIELHAYHGVYPRERKEGNRYRVDLYMEQDLEAAAASDALGDTLDYFQAYQLVLEVMREPVNLLETLVVRIGHQALERFPQLTAIRVRVSKIQPIAMDNCRQTYVEMSFSPR